MWLRTSSSSWTPLCTTTRSSLLTRSYSWNPLRRPGATPLSIGKRVGIHVLKVVNFLFAVHLFTTYVARATLMSGPSMLPTLAPSGEIVIEDCLTYRLFPAALARGDLITLESPIAPGRIICKRLIGLPGDTVCVDPTGEFAPSTEHVLVPKGHIWISGDNAAASRDSRTYGPVPIGLVKGRLFARIWPLRSFTVFKNPITYIE